MGKSSLKRNEKYQTWVINHVKLQIKGGYAGTI